MEHFNWQRPCVRVLCLPHYRVIIIHQRDGFESQHSRIHQPSIHLNAATKRRYGVEWLQNRDILAPRPISSVKREWVGYFLETVFNRKAFYALLLNEHFFTAENTSTNSNTFSYRLVLAFQKIFVGAILSLTLRDAGLRQVPVGCLDQMLSIDFCSLAKYCYRGINQASHARYSLGRFEPSRLRL